jgi:hypothetical protein
MATELQRCGMCQLMKPNGIFSDDGSVFICDRCNANAVQFLAIQDDLFAPPEAPAKG